MRPVPEELQAQQAFPAAQPAGRHALSRRQLLGAAGAAAVGVTVGLGKRQDSHAVPAGQLPLRQLADLLGMNFGIFYEQQWRPGSPVKLWEIAAKEFNTGCFYWNMNQQEGQLDLSLFRELTDFSKSHNMKVYGHPLLNGADVADWLREPKYQSRSAMIQAVRLRIRTIVETFRGEIYAWSTVNEYGYGGDLYLQTIGPDYPEIAFETAREADPNAILLYNDGWNHVSTSPTTQRTHMLVERLRAKGLIDAVGVQLHLNHWPIDEADTIATMRSYGLPVLVTEFDCNIHELLGTQAERFAFQAAQYRGALHAAIKSGVCRDFIVWGLIDKWASWETVQSLPGYSKSADPCPFDDDFQPKPAYYALRSVLEEAVNERFTFKHTAPLVSFDP